MLTGAVIWISVRSLSGPARELTLPVVTLSSLEILVAQRNPAIRIDPRAHAAAVAKAGDLTMGLGGP
jgi:hypothetical protein